MTRKYSIILKERIIANGYISPHPYYKDHCNASIMPIRREGKWVDDNLEIVFDKLLTNIFSCSMSAEKMMRELLAQDNTEWWKCDIVEDKIMSDK